MKFISWIIAIVILVAGGGIAYYVLTMEPSVVADEHGHEGGQSGPALPEEPDAEATGEHGEPPETSGHEGGESHAGEESGGHAAQEETAVGPHNGRLLKSETLDLEVTIFEEGVPPEFRVYPYTGGTPVSPAQVKLVISLRRFGGRTDRIEFTPQEDYLRSLQAVEEPHSFDVEVEAALGGASQHWEYDSYEGRTTMSAEGAAQAGVKTEMAGPVEAAGTLELPGAIKLNQDRVIHVVPRLSGLVREVHKSLGNDVKEGELLAVVDSKELASAKSEYLAALERRELAQARYNMENDLRKKKISPEQDFLEARQALAEGDINVRASMQKLQSLGIGEEAIAGIGQQRGHSLTSYEVRSPIDGTVIEKHLALGEAVKDDSDVFVLADLTSVWVEIVVYAADLNRVRTGQSVGVRSEDLGLSAEGTISYIGDLVGETTRAARAIVDLPNPDRAWRPGLFVTVTVAEGAIQFPVAVPEEALQTFRDWNVVFLASGDTYQAQPVELGRRAGGWLEVTAGLKPGDTYVSKNSYLIKADIEKSGASHDH